jgi:hypothetical protein
MEFFLPFHIQSFPFNISHREKILFMGSCFSEEIGNRLADLKFNIFQNPNGILYDPPSISQAIFSYIENAPIRQENLFESNGIWHSWKHHSSFSGINKNDVVAKIQASQSEAHSFLKEAEFLFITFGTAYYYQLHNDKEIVANCHKAPSHFFDKKMLAIQEMIDVMIQTIKVLQRFNPSIKVIFTVSPVKHVRDGVVENNRSKARLIEATHSIIEQQENVFYFPSFELVNDILRDYRFFKSDLVHPADSAIDFVFEKFSDSFFDLQTKKIIDEIKKIKAAVNHKVFFRESEQHQKFITTALDTIHRIQHSYPFLNLSAEEKYFLTQ